MQRKKKQQLDPGFAKVTMRDTKSNTHTPHTTRHTHHAPLRQCHHTTITTHRPVSSLTFRHAAPRYASSPAPLLHFLSFLCAAHHLASAFSFCCAFASSSSLCAFHLWLRSRGLRLRVTVGAWAKIDVRASAWV